MAIRIADRVQLELESEGAGWLPTLFGHGRLAGHIQGLLDERPGLVPQRAVEDARAQIANRPYPIENLDSELGTIARLLVAMVADALKPTHLDWVVRGGEDELWNVIRGRLEWNLESVLVELILATDMGSMARLAPVFQLLPEHTLRDVRTRLSDLPDRARSGRGLLKKILESPGEHSPA